MKYIPTGCRVKFSEVFSLALASVVDKRQRDDPRAVIIELAGERLMQLGELRKDHKEDHCEFLLQE